MQTKTYFSFGDRLSIQLPADTDRESLQAFWHSFCARMGTLEPLTGEPGQITVGNAQFLPLSDDEEYTLCIREEGIGILGKDTASLMRGFAALLMQIETEDTARFRIQCGDIRGRFSVTRRMIHLYVFPETSLSMLARLLRLCGVLSYTHVVLEFWGMFSYEGLDALSW